jgi:hypothetical protein
MSSCTIVTAPRQRKAGRPQPPAGGALQAHFLSILPRIEQHARIYFRNVRCPGKREDAEAETVAICWRWFVRLAERGKDARRFPTVLASYAARAVKCGRRLCGPQAGKDALSPLAQSRHGFCVQALPDLNPSPDNPFAEALADNVVSPVPEQVCFRMDFPAWLLTRAERDRRMIADMMTGERTDALAERFGLSAARVSQLRSEYHADWVRFCGDAQ